MGVLGLETYRLVPHPAHPPRDVTDVLVRVSTAESYIWLGYEVSHGGVIKLTDHPDGRANDLWRNTCFELFARRPGQEHYIEYNFAPIAAWAVYAFDSYRSGMQNAEISPPHLVDGRLEDRAGEIDRYYEYCVVIPREGILASGVAQLNLSAVIEETSGHKSYWALRHPPGDKPDFHHPDCFALDLPAPA